MNELIEQYSKRREFLDEVVRKHNSRGTVDSKECQVALEDMARTNDILHKLRRGEDLTLVSL